MLLTLILKKTDFFDICSGKGTKKGTDKAAFNTERNEIDVGKPNKILFVEHLPEATTANMLAVLFKQFPGRRRLVQQY